MRRAETWKKVARAPNPKWVTTRSKKEKGGMEIQTRERESIAAPKSRYARGYQSKNFVPGRFETKCWTARALI
jgi:hypothetical protein